MTAGLTHLEYRVGDVAYTRRIDGVAVVTLDAPQRRNAITAGLAGDIVSAIESAEADPAARALVVTGTPPAFCAGADLGALDGANEQVLRTIYCAFLRVRQSPLPSVAAVGGAAIGAGLNLAMACDVRVVSPAARFDARFLQLGVHPGGGAAWMLHQTLGRGAVAAMLLFGRPVGGEQAARSGIAWNCVPADELLETAVELAAGAAAAPPELTATIKQTIDSAWTVPDHASNVEIELERQLWSFAQPWYGQQRQR